MACSHIPLHALDEHLHHLIAQIRYWWQAVETGTFLGVIDGLIDHLNLVHTSINQYKPVCLSINCYIQYVQGLC